MFDDEIGEGIIREAKRGVSFDEIASDIRSTAFDVERYFNAMAKKTEKDERLTALAKPNGRYK